MEKAVETSLLAELRAKGYAPSTNASLLAKDFCAFSAYVDQRLILNEEILRSRHLQVNKEFILLFVTKFNQLVMTSKPTVVLFICGTYNYSNKPSGYGRAILSRPLPSIRPASVNFYDSGGKLLSTWYIEENGFEESGEMNIVSLSSMRYSIRIMTSEEWAAKIVAKVVELIPNYQTGGQ